MKARSGTIVALLALCFVLAACGDKKDDAPGSAGGDDCGTHESIATPEWLPSDLPLPEGSEVIDLAEESNGYQGASIAMPVSTDGFREFIEAEWPGAGYEIEDSEHEEAEVEGEFNHGDQGGFFKTVSDGCDGHSVMILRLEAA